MSIYVSDNRGYKIFEGIDVNQRDLVLTLTPAEPRPKPTPEQQARRKAQEAYVEDAEERFKTLVNKPAPELAVAQWLSGSSVSLEDLKGKMIALFFWHVKGFRSSPMGTLVESFAGGIWRERARLCCHLLCHHRT